MILQLPEDVSVEAHRIFIDDFVCHNDFIAALDYVAAVQNYVRADTFQLHFLADCPVILDKNLASVQVSGW